MFDFSNDSPKSKKKLWWFKQTSLGKMKDESGGVAIEELVVLKPKMYSFLVEDNREHKAKGVNKNVVAAISHNKYKDVLLKNKCIRHSMNRIQSKDDKIGTCEIKKFMDFFWWQNVELKEWVSLISFWISELIVKITIHVTITII